jgi:DnaJ-class molecular chaperone
VSGYTFDVCHVCGSSLTCVCNIVDCECCEGRGEIDQGLGGTGSGIGWTMCPDCDGRGVFFTPPIENVPCPTSKDPNPT